MNEQGTTWNAADLARHYQITKQTIYKRRSKQPELLPPAIKVGRRVMWDPDTVRAYDLEHQEKKSPEEPTPGRED